jgi:hypothetical protein
MDQLVRPLYLSDDLFLAAALGAWVYPALNINEYQKQKYKNSAD